MVDPLTGEVRSVQLGSSRRVKTIFETNLKTSYAAGHWKQTVETADDAPYLMYDAIDDDKTRPQHREWDGVVLRWDDSFWDTHYPPNGWNCRCGVIQLDEEQLAAMGKSGADKAPAVKTREWINPRTGEVLDVPVGIDPGWGYHAGRDGAKSLYKTLAEKLEGAPDDLAQAALGGLVRSPLFENWVDSPVGAFPVLQLKREAAKAIGADRRVAVLSKDSLVKNKNSHPDLTLGDYRVLPDMGFDPTVIVRDGENTVVLVRRGGGIFWAAVKAARPGGKETFITSFRKSNVENVAALLKKGKVIFGKWK